MKEIDATTEWRGCIVSGRVAADPSRSQGTTAAVISAIGELGGRILDTLVVGGAANHLIGLLRHGRHSGTDDAELELPWLIALQFGGRDATVNVETL